MKSLQQIAFCVLCALLFLQAGNLNASERWTVRGSLKVKHFLGFMKDHVGESSPLAGVQVKVYARAKNFAGWGTWNSWEVVRTKSDGSFSVSKETGSDRRQFKIEILFDSDELRIREGQETSLTIGGNGFPIDIDLDLTAADWHEIYNEKDAGPEDGHRAGVTDVGTLTLNRSNILNKHGDIWVLYNQIFDLFDSYGGAYSFQKKVKLKYPMNIGNNGTSTASYTNPLNDHIYIKESDFDGNALIHELMHFWVYPHTTGEDGLTWQLIKHGTTHDAREATTFVPFHEGFAEFAAYKVLREITGWDATRFNNDDEDLRPNRPYSRSHIGAIEPLLANVDYTEAGWYSLFNILTFKNLGKLNFNLGDTYAESGTLGCTAADLDYTFKDVLSLFLTHPSKGVSDKLSNDTENFRDFLNRAKKILPGMTDDRVKHIKVYLNPGATDNPRDLYCKPTQATINPNLQDIKTNLPKGVKKGN